MRSVRDAGLAAALASASAAAASSVPKSTAAAASNASDVVTTANSTSTSVVTTPAVAATAASSLPGNTNEGNFIQKLLHILCNSVPPRKTDKEDIKVTVDGSIYVAWPRAASEVLNEHNVLKQKQTVKY